MIGNEIPERTNSLLLLLAAEIVTGDPVASTVAFIDLFPPATTLPKLRLVGEIVNWPAAISAPERAIFSVEFLAVDTRPSIPLAEPAESGVNVTVKVSLSFGERFAGRLSPFTEKPDPLMFAAEMVTAEPPVLVTVSDKSELLLLGTLPKASVAAVALRTEPVATVGPPEAIPPQPVSAARPTAIKSELVNPLINPLNPRCDRQKRNG